MQRFLLQLLDEDAVILVRGNHEDLYEEMVTVDEGLPVRHHVSNGTYGTAQQLTGFDEACRRLGMGGGFYDRYLPKCVNAGIVAVAFECQKAKEVPAEAWDKPVDAVFTEDAVYRR